MDILNRMDTNVDEHYIKRETGGGTNSPTFYIIRRIKEDLEPGLFSNYVVFAGHIRYALSKGYLPVVDMQNYPNVFLEPELLGKVNAWEYYFCQPLGIDLETAYNGANIILSGRCVAPMPDFSTNYFENKNGILTEWRMLVKLGILKIQPKLYEEFIKLRQKLFNPTDRVLGVSLRGTDYVAQKYYNHYIQPPIEYALTKTIEKFKEWRCNKIFLATEDINILQVYKRIFGNICVTIDRDLSVYNTNKLVSTPNDPTEKKTDLMLRGLEYLREMAILSMCNCLVAGRTSGNTAIAMMGDFENIYTFNFGRYGVIGLD